MMMSPCTEDSGVGGRAKRGAGDRTEASGAQRIPCGKPDEAWRRDQGSVKQVFFLQCLRALRAASWPSLLLHPQKILIGPKGHLISQIAQEVGRDLMDIFLCDVRLRLSVKLLK